MIVTPLLVLISAELVNLMFELLKRSNVHVDE